MYVFSYNNDFLPMYFGSLVVLWCHSWVQVWKTLTAILDRINLFSWQALFCIKSTQAQHRQRQQLQVPQFIFCSSGRSKHNNINKKHWNHILGIPNKTSLVLLSPPALKILKYPGITFLPRKITNTNQDLVSEFRVLNSCCSIFRQLFLCALRWGDPRSF